MAVKTINIYNAECEKLGVAHYVLQDGKYLYTVFAVGIKLGEYDAVNLRELIRTARGVLHNTYKSGMLLSY